jgi:MFS family permease
VADRYPRRSILIATQVAAMSLAVVLALLADNRWVPIQAWHIAVLAALMGAVNAFNMPAQQALVPELVEDRKVLGNAIALNSIMFNIARFLGPVLAGLVLVRFGAAACFGLNAASYLAVIASLGMIRLPHRERTLQKQSVWEGFRFIWQVRSVFRTVALMGTASLLVWSASTLFPVLAAHFGQGATGYTGIMAVNGIGAALGGMLIAAYGQRMERRTLVYGAPILCCAAFIALSYAGAYPLALVCLFAAGFAMILFGVSAQTKVQEDVPDALRGRVMAVYSLVFSGMMPLGGLLVGFMAEHQGAMTAIRINSLLCLLVTGLLFVWSQRDMAAAALHRPDSSDVPPLPSRSHP